MPAENGGGAPAARRILRELELLTTDGLQGELLHGYRLSPRCTHSGLGARLNHATGRAARRRVRALHSSPTGRGGVDLSPVRPRLCSPIHYGAATAGSPSRSGSTGGSARTSWPEPPSPPGSVARTQPTPLPPSRTQHSDAEQLTRSSGWDEESARLRPSGRRAPLHQGSAVRSISTHRAPGSSVAFASTGYGAGFVRDLVDRGRLCRLRPVAAGHRPCISSNNTC
jgi:hypothetical protein